MTRSKLSRVIYRGPSLLDGKPIVCIAVVTKPGKANSKTGAMMQTYILRSDIHPMAANKSGEDFSICGTCPHRGIPTNRADRKLALKRTCYVNMGQGVLVTWKAFQCDYYPDITGHAAIAALGKGRKIRLGTYGDPAAVPAYVWESLLSEAADWTAYSHQSGMANASFVPSIMMQSADTITDAESAWANGHRTFRVISDVSDMAKGKEILCPASKEAGYRTTCIACGLCKGSAIKAKSIAIVVHGSGARHFGTGALFPAPRFDDHPTA